MSQSDSNVLILFIVVHCIVLFVNRLFVNVHISLYKSTHIYIQVYDVNAFISSPLPAAFQFCFNANVEPSTRYVHYMYK